MLDDGTYDVIVFDADHAPEGGLVVELTVLAGPRKGEVVSLRSNEWDQDPIDLLGIPATLTVEAGNPSVVFEP